MSTKLILGCVADDFTGGSDAASFLAAGGMNTVFCNGIPNEDFRLPEDCDAVVIALKSRTQQTDAAVADSIAAISWLRDQGASHYYIKYCSTFDSTPKGNIGPILDGVLEHLGEKTSLLCPALPANDRKVLDGILYVKGIPLAESPMKDHPLTPMWESRVAKLMEPQSRYASMELHRDLLYRENDLRAAVASFAADKERYYLIPDYAEDADAEQIVKLFGDLAVLSGGSGILTALARHLKPDANASVGVPAAHGPAIIVAGSCSVATNAQREYYLAQGGKALRLEDDLLLNGRQNPETLWQQAKTLGDAALVYAYETPEGLKAKRDEKGKALSALIEQNLSGTAALAVKDGVCRVISAGGETSGAVTKALGFQAFRIGNSIAPGVPIMMPLEQPQVRLVLKSGNFGQEDFFVRALKMMEE